MSAYDLILTTSEIDLNANFRDKFSDILKIGTRGFGYWCWKPQIILQTLQPLEDGDVGCHLNAKGHSHLMDYFNIVKSDKNGVLAIANTVPQPPFIYDGRKLFYYPEYQFIKGDLLDYFQIRGSVDILESQSSWAGVIFFKARTLFHYISREH